MWRKSNFYEFAARVPLVLSWPVESPAGRRVPEVISLVDLIATLVGSPRAPRSRHSTAIICWRWRTVRTTAGKTKPSQKCWRTVSHDRWRCSGAASSGPELQPGRSAELYDLSADPGEFHDLAGDPAYHDVVEDLRARLLSHWDPLALEREVRQSQQERLLIRRAENGATSAKPGGSGTPVARR